MVDQPQWNVSIGGPILQTRYGGKVLHVQVNCKLSKIAFRNSGSNNGVRHANVIIRRGEGIDGDILYQDTWEFGNRFWDEYEIPTNVDINLTNGEKYTIQLESPTGAGQTQPSLMGRNSNVYSGGHFFRTGYNVYGDATFRQETLRSSARSAAGTITITNSGNLWSFVPDTINGIAVTEIGNVSYPVNIYYILNSVTQKFSELPSINNRRCQ